MFPDPFDLLGLPARFDLSPAQIRAAHLARSATLHPDMALDDPEASDQSAAINHARRTLENPETRAEALLARLGGVPKEQDRSLPPAFLQEMLETREEIDAAIAAGNKEEAVKWDQWADDRRRHHIKEVSRLFEEAGGSAADGKREEAGGQGGPGKKFPALRAIRLELNMWRYVERLIEQLHGRD